MSPSDVTARPVDDLSPHRDVLNLVVLHSAARLPDGDAVQFDVMRGQANGVLARLRQLGAGRSSSVIIEEVDAALDTTKRTGWRPSYQGQYAPVWEVVAANITSNATYSPSFYALLAFAGIIGACGILTNSEKRERW